MTVDELDLLEAYFCSRSRDDFLAFRKYISGFNLKVNWFVEEVSSAIQQFYIDYKDGKRPILVVQAPPQHGKSEVVTDGIAWMAGHDPSLRFIYASFSERLGIRANLKLQRMFDKPLYKGIFKDFKINDRRTVTAAGYQRNKEMIEFAGNVGSFRNTTVRGSITGETLDIGIIDDPIKGREEANSETVRDKTWNWFTDDFQTRFDELGGLIIILTRWHIDDPVGRLLKINKNVKLLTYKAVAEVDEKHRNTGEALFPEHKSVEFLNTRKESMPISNWQSLYQQNPIILGGNLFKSEWWKYYTILPEMEYRLIFGDTALKTKEANDYSVLQCWGKAKGENKIYLIDQIRGKWESPQLLTTAKAFWNKHENADTGKLRQMMIEDKASGTGLIQQLRQLGVPVKGIPRSIDKVTRMNDGAPQVEVGNVLLPSDAPFISDYMSEFEQAPNGTHDDQIDPTLDAIDKMLVNTSTGFFIG